ncbi:MAG: type II toxin-antitoxin system VapC family toxin [Verrucomicrobiota bacterium]
MAVLIDTNVISDVIHADPLWEEWALARIAANYGDLVINPVIYAELSCRAESVEALDAILEPFELDYFEIPKQALFLAAQAFLKYRKRGGTKSSPLPDFFIGAHAAALEVPLLTRDVARYQTYFPEVELIAP